MDGGRRATWTRWGCLVLCVGLAHRIGGPRGLHALDHGAPLAAAPRFQVDLPANLHLANSFGGALRVVALDGDIAYFVAGRRLHVHDLGRERGDTEVGLSAPLGLPVHDIEPLGDLVVLLGGATNATGELTVVDVSDPAAPAITARLPLLQNAHGMAVHGGDAWLAKGRRGVQRIDLSDPAAPRMAELWRNQTIRDSAVHGAIDVVDVGTAIVALVGGIPNGGTPVFAEQITALTYDSAVGIVERSSAASGCNRRAWAGGGGRFTCITTRRTEVWSYADPAAPRTVALPGLPRAMIPTGLHLVDGDLAVVAGSPARVTGYDLDNRALVTDDVAVRLGDSDSPQHFSDDDGRRVLVANDSAFAVLPTVPKPVVVRPYPLALQRYRRVSHAADGLWFLDDRGRLEHRTDDGALRDADVSTVGLFDILDRPGGPVALAHERGPVRLAKRVDGQLVVRASIAPTKAVWDGRDEPAGNWRWIHGSPELLAIGTDHQFVGALGDQGDAPQWGGYTIEGPLSAKSVVVEDRRLVYVSAGARAIKVVTFGLDGTVQREAPPNLSWMGVVPAFSQPEAIAGARGRYVVGDTAGMLTGVDWTGTEPRVTWTIDLPGPVHAVAIHGDQLWAQWGVLALGPTRGPRPPYHDDCNRPHRTAHARRRRGRPRHDLRRRGRCRTCWPSRTGCGACTRTARSCATGSTRAALTCRRLPRRRLPRPSRCPPPPTTPTATAWATATRSPSPIPDERPRDRILLPWAMHGARVTQGRP